jgi:putative oxidoreductase
MGEQCYSSGTAQGSTQVVLEGKKPAKNESSGLRHLPTRLREQVYRVNDGNVINSSSIRSLCSRTQSREHPVIAPPLEGEATTSFWGVMHCLVFFTIRQGRSLQRLFSTFPSDWPGAGLLLLRLTAGVPLVIGGISEIRGAPQSATLALAAAAVVSGILVVVGLWTPVAASLGTLLELWLVFSRTGYQETPILLASITASLAMLGPGAWSIDGRLFGRKRIEFRDR